MTNAICGFGYLACWADVNCCMSCTDMYLMYSVVAAVHLWKFLIVIPIETPALNPTS